MIPMGIEKYSLQGTHSIRKTRFDVFTFQNYRFCRSIRNKVHASPAPFFFANDPAFAPAVNLTQGLVLSIQQKVKALAGMVAAKRHYATVQKDQGTGG